MFRFGSDLGDSLVVVSLNVSSAILRRGNSDREQLAFVWSPEFNFVYHVCNRELCSPDGLLADSAASGWRFALP